MFNPFNLDFAISILISFLREQITPESKGKYKKALLKVFREIAKQYADDKDFKVK